MHSPFKRLTQYKNIFDGLIKNLYKIDKDANKSKLASCSKTFENINRLCNKINDSMYIAEIRNCNEIDVNSKGNFKMMSAFNAYDYGLRRQYCAKLFMFELCIVVCEVSEDGLDYRDYYESNDIKLHHTDGQKKFQLVKITDSSKSIELYSNSNRVSEWTNAILKACVVAKTTKPFRRSAAAASSTNDPFLDEIPLIRKSMSMRQLKGPQIAPKPRKKISFCKKLIDDEEQYVQVLLIGIKAYIHQPNYQRNSHSELDTFGNIEGIYNLHNQKLLPAMKQCNESFDKMAQLIENAVENDDFYCYVTYAINYIRSLNLCERNEGYWKVRKKVKL